MSHSPFTPRLEESTLQKKLYVAKNGAPKHSLLAKKSSAPLPNPHLSGKDGVDHINICRHGETNLGVALSNNIELGFEHAVLGRFCSMEAFWFYIQSRERDDRLRVMVGRVLKIFAAQMTDHRIPNFAAVIMDGHYQKVLQYPEIMEELRNSTLPFEYYTVYKRVDGIRMRPTFASWLIRGFEEIRRAVKEDRPADFGFLMTHKHIDLVQSVMPCVEIPERRKTPRPLTP